MPMPIASLSPNPIISRSSRSKSKWRVSQEILADWKLNNLLFCSTGRTKMCDNYNLSMDYSYRPLRTIICKNFYNFFNLKNIFEWVIYCEKNFPRPRPNPVFLKIFKIIFTKSYKSLIRISYYYISIGS